MFVPKEERPDTVFPAQTSFPHLTAWKTPFAIGVTEADEYRRSLREPKLFDVHIIRIPDMEIPPGSEGEERPGEPNMCSEYGLM